MTDNNTQDLPIPLAKQTIMVPTEVFVTRERIAYTLCAALEGGSNYWCDRVKVEDYRGHEWAHEAIAASSPFTFSVFEDDEGGKLQHPKLTLSAALKKMADEYNSHFWDMMTENEDADTGDVLFQLICFGEIVFG